MNRMSTVMLILYTRNKREPCEITFCDFDGKLFLTMVNSLLTPDLEVSYKISVAAETPSVVVVHMAMKTIGALKKYVSVCLGCASFTYFNV